MTDYRIEAATKEEWAERALKAEAKLAKAEDLVVQALFALFALAENKEARMTDEKLLHELRNSKGWPTLGNAAADRIEELEAKLIETAKGLAGEIRRADAAEAKLAAERERCAEVAESHKPSASFISERYWRGVDEAAHSIAVAIRKGGE